MGWVLLSIMAVLAALAVAYFFPGLARGLLNAFNSVKYALLAVVGVIIAFYFLTSGVGILVLIGFLALMLATWQFMFNDPIGVF